MSWEVLSWQSSVLDAVKRGNAPGKKSCLRYYLDSQATSFLQYCSELYFKATCCQNQYYFSFQWRVHSASSESSPMFPALETGKVENCQRDVSFYNMAVPPFTFFLFLSIKLQNWVCAVILFRKAMRGYHGNHFVFQDLKKHWEHGITLKSEQIIQNLWEPFSLPFTSEPWIWIADL